MLGGEGILSDILVDDVYYSVSETPLTNTNLNPDRNLDVQLPEFKVEADFYQQLLMTEKSSFHSVPPEAPVGGGLAFMMTTPMILPILQTGLSRFL
jgi:hypothetical protein